MKIVAVLFLLFSAMAFAEDSCLRFMKADQSKMFLCGHEDTTGQNIFAFNNLDICFVGSAQTLTDKINSGLFKNTTAGISSAVKVNGFEINVTFWIQGGNSLKKTINKCE